LQKQLCIGFAKKNNTNAKRLAQSHFDSEARPCTPAKKKAIRVGEWLFSVKSVLTDGINPPSVDEIATRRNLPCGRRWADLI